MNKERIKARELIQKGSYNEAIKVYYFMWNEKEEILDEWLGWEYASALKKVGRIDDAIKICRVIYKNNSTFRYNNHLYSWCLYEKYFKNLNLKEKPNDIETLIKIGKFIVNITEQNEKLPYEKTVWKIIELNKEPFNVEVIHEWLEKLDVEKLSDNIAVVVIDNKKIKLASSKEKWFYLKSKCLKAMKRYEECIGICELAFEQIKEFHNNRDVWLHVYRAECIFKIGRAKEAIDILTELSQKKEHWVIHSTIFQMKVETGEVEEGLINAFTAALSKEEKNVKVKLFFEIGRVLEKKGDSEYALMHYLLSRELRNEKNWSVPKELESCIERLSYEVEVKSDNLIKELNEFWTNSKLVKTIRYEGCVLSIMPNNKAGFIRLDSENYYFRVNSILNFKKDLKIGAKVSFSIVESFDRKKQRSSKEAKDILFLN